MPKIGPNTSYKRYAVPMFNDDAARIVAVAAINVQAIADQLHRHVDRLNQRPVRPFTRREQLERAKDMRIKRPVKPADAKPKGRPTLAEVAARQSEKV